MAPNRENEIAPNGESALQPVVGVTERAEELVGSIGQTAETATQVLQETFRRTKRSARIAIKNVSHDIQTSTDYLTENGVVGVVEDAEALIRRYPFQALLIGFSLGYLLSRSRKR